MQEIQADTLCPCNSGLTFRGCCDGHARSAEDRGAVPRQRLHDHNGTGRQLPGPVRQALADIAIKPDLFPLRLDWAEQKMLWVKMSPRWYNESVFLDPKRVRGGFVLESDLAWLDHAMRQAQWQPTGFIFHTAFCGSTLLSQALALLNRSLPLREPDVLSHLYRLRHDRGCDDSVKNLWLERVMQLLSRRYESNQPVVVKANDHTNALLPTLLQWHAQLRVLFLYTPLSEFIVACVKNDFRRKWTRQRLRFILQNHGFIPTGEPIEFHPETLDDIGKATLIWCDNIRQFHLARASAPAHIISLDFNQLLAEPGKTLQMCAQWFQLPAMRGASSASLLQKLLGVYSKNPDQPYSPAQRQWGVRLAWHQHKQAISKAQDLAERWLGDLYPKEGLPNSLLKQAQNKSEFP